MNLNKSLQVKAELKRLLHSSTGFVPLREAADTNQLRRLMSTLDTSPSQSTVQHVVAAFSRLCHSVETYC